jgi:formyl-CoA transferase
VLHPLEGFVIQFNCYGAHPATAHLYTGSRCILPPVRLSATPLRPQGASPALGQHTDELLRALGYDEARITDLRARGIVH